MFKVLFTMFNVLKVKEFILTNKWHSKKSDFKIGRFGLENRIILSWLHVAFTIHHWLIQFILLLFHPKCLIMVYFISHSRVIATSAPQLNWLINETPLSKTFLLFRT